MNDSTTPAPKRDAKVSAELELPGLMASTPPATRRTERAITAAAVLILALSGGTALSRGGPSQGSLDIPAPVAVPDDLPTPSAVSAADDTNAREAAGCDLLVDGEPLEDRNHLDASAPPAAALYPDTRPAHSGRHFAQVLELPDRVPDAPIDERAVLHNMEHGSVVVWFDPAQVGGAVVGEMQAWMRERRALGFTSRAAGGIFVSSAERISSGKGVALRAWGMALDCDRFDVTVADAFLGRHWGSRGASPEGHLSPFPPGVMGETGAAV